MRTAIQAIAACAALLAVGCANELGPLCLSTVTAYVEGAKSKSKSRALYGLPDGERFRTRERGVEARVGVAFEWDLRRGACEDGDDRV